MWTSQAPGGVGVAEVLVDVLGLFAVGGNVGLKDAPVGRFATAIWIQIVHSERQHGCMRTMVRAASDKSCHVGRCCYVRVLCCIRLAERRPSRCLHLFGDSTGATQRCVGFGMLSSASPTKSEPVGLDLRPGRSLLATIPSAGAATRRPSSSPMSTTEPSVANSQGSAPGPI